MPLFYRKLPYFFLFVSVLFISISSNAYSDASKGKKIIVTFSDKIMSFHSMNINFSITLNNKNIEDVINGKIIIQNKMYRLEMKDMHEYFNGTTKWTYLKDLEEVEVSNDNPENLFDPFEILQEKDDAFKYKFIKESTLDEKPVNIVEIFPKTTGDKKYFKIQFTIGKTDNLLKKSLIYEKGGQIITYLVKNFEYNKKYTQKFFEFDETKNSDVEIIDLR